MREALRGCWEPWPGERWEFLPRAASGMRVMHTFEAELLGERFALRGSPRPYEAALRYRSREDEIDMNCGPTTQHGQSCVLTVEGDRVRVGLYAAGPGAGHGRGRLIDTVDATRCQP